MQNWRDKLILSAVTIISTLILWWMAGMGTIYRNFDGPYYIAVAKTWYDKAALGGQFSFNLPLEYYPAHFPLYPLFISVLSNMGINHMQAMVGINLVAAVLLALTIYSIAQKSGWKNPFWIALATMFFWPRMLAVRSVGSPETLFMLTTAVSLYFFDKGKYFPAAIAGSLAILTKSPGVLLIPTFVLLWIKEAKEKKKLNFSAWPILLMGGTLIGLFYFYFLKTGDFWAYFHTGDNIHLGILPFRVFDSSQSWVGSFWLEDVIFVYLLGGLGVFYALKKNKTWGLFGAVYYLSLLFVSHRDISRYSLPLIPIILMGVSDLWNRKEIRWATVLIIIPILFYSLNFIRNNTLSIADWAPLL
jgi:hypothetical protein